MTEKIEQVTKRLSEREKVSAIIWAVVGVTNTLSFLSMLIILPFALILTVLTLGIYGFLLGMTISSLISTFLFGAWGIYMAIVHFKKSKNVLAPKAGTVEAYEKSFIFEKSTGGVMISLLMAVLFGNVIHVLCALYDMLFVREYALDNKDALNAAVEATAEAQEEEVLA